MLVFHGDLLVVTVGSFINPLWFCLFCFVPNLIFLEWSLFILEIKGEVRLHSPLPFLVYFGDPQLPVPCLELRLTVPHHTQLSTNGVPNKGFETSSFLQQLLG